jgi:hypothetical protein
MNSDNLNLLLLIGASTFSLPQGPATLNPDLDVVLVLNIVRDALKIST